MYDWTNTFSCACGCAETVRTKRWHETDTEHYASDACRQRAYRRRKRAERIKALGLTVS
jgi:hypothetical protein